MHTVAFIERIYNTNLPLLSTTDEAQLILEDLERFEISPPVYHLLKSKELLDEVPEFISAALKMKTERVFFNNLFIRSEMRRLLSRMDELQIDVIPLKGVQLAETYFGHLSARGTSDIDLLIRPMDLQRTSELLEKLGYEKEDEADSAHFHQVYTKSFSNQLFDSLSVEIHWNILRGHTSNTQVDALWEQAEPMLPYRYVHELTTQHTFYHLCLHGYNHHILSLKYVIDIVHFLYTKAEHIDYSELFEQAKRDGNYSKMIIVLTHVYDLFPSLRAARPLPEEKRWPLWDLQLMRKQVADVKDMQYYLFRMFSTFMTYDQLSHSVAHLRYMIFPPRDFASFQLTTAQNKHKSLIGLYGHVYSRRMRQLFTAYQARKNEQKGH
ncbi:nucleotidyltransferase family protein [Paenibacillus sp. GCM10023252]|uniref:nucleotidyltransferase domain-containing protein n=1 Tax=Paenibacillus sp. GCM10023252 TaxID=3252649 RepID=UPI0036198353